jgi:hypothetical protein
MKKTMLLLVTVLMLGFMSCSKDDDTTKEISTVKQSWVLTIRTTVTSQGISETTAITQDVNDKTEAEVIAYVKTLEKTTQTQAGVTTKISVTYATKVLSTVKKSWILTMTETTSVNIAMPGFPKVIVDTQEVNNMTEAEVIAFATSFEQTTEINSAGYILTTKITVTYAAKQ